MRLLSYQCIPANFLFFFPAKSCITKRVKTKKRYICPSYTPARFSHEIGLVSSKNSETCVTVYSNRWNCMRTLHEIHYKIGEEKKKKTKQKVKMVFCIRFHLRQTKHKAQSILIDKQFLISFWLQNRFPFWINIRF